MTMNQGIEVTYNVILAKINEKFQAIFSEQTIYESSSGLAGRKDYNEVISVWSSEISFKQEGSSFYDLILHKKGTEDGKPVNKKLVFKFDGNKYSTSDVYK